MILQVDFYGEFAIVRTLGRQLGNRSGENYLFGDAGARHHYSTLVIPLIG